MRCLASTPGQSGQSPPVSTRSLASARWSPAWPRSAGPCSRQVWPRAGTATAGIIQGRQRCRCGSGTSCCTCTPPLGASLCPGNPPRASRRVPSSESAREPRRPPYLGIIVPVVSRGPRLFIDAQDHRYSSGRSAQKLLSAVCNDSGGPPTTFVIGWRTIADPDGPGQGRQQEPAVPEEGVRRHPLGKLRNCNPVREAVGRIVRFCWQNIPLCLIPRCLVSFKLVSSK